MNLIIYWSYVIIILLISFIPGFAIANYFKNLTLIEKLAISFGFSFLILLVPMPFFAFKLTLLGQLFLIGIIIVSLWYLLKKRAEFKLDIDARFIILVLVIGLVSKFLLQTFWEYPVMGGDWFGHAFERPYIFETGDWSPDRDRTPLFGLLIYAYHELLGTSLYQYWISQIISVVINSLYIFPAFLIARKAFGDRVAKSSALFMLVTPFLIFNTLYTWPKNAAMYGVLMMIYFLFFCEQDLKVRYPLAGFFAGLGFWFHNYALFYIGIAVLLLIYREKMYKGLLSKNNLNNLKKLSYFLLALFLVLLPYFAWVYSYYGTISTSKTIYYPIAVNGYESAINQNPEYLWNTFKSTPLKDIIIPRISNIIITLMPAALPINPLAASLPTYNPIYYYSHDYPGGLSSLMYVIVVIWFIRYISRKTKTDPILVGFLILPLLLNMFLYAWKEWGLLTGWLHPTVPLLIIIGFNEIHNWKSKFKNALFYAIFVSAIIEDGIYSVLIKNFYIIEGGFQHVSKMGQQFIPDFQISNFVSAHFLFNNNIDLLADVLISAGIVLLVYIFYNNQSSSYH